jgi:glycosyltransferase involved in cell wall biosynthesis
MQLWPIAGELIRLRSRCNKYPEEFGMRIALVSHAVGFQDGQGRVNYEIARGALHAGMEVTLVAESCADDLATHHRVRLVKIPVSALPTRFLKNLSFAVRSTRWLKQNRKNIDIIQANGFITFAPADVVAAHFVHGAWLRSPYARTGTGWSLRAFYQPVYTRMNAYLEQVAFRRAKRVVAVSENVATELRGAGLVDRQIAVIFNGVDLDEFSPGESNRSLFRLPGDVPLFLFSGDIRTCRKNLDTVLRAVAQVEGLHLAVAGAFEGSPYPNLARELGIADRVHFLGHITQMSVLMGAADAFIFPSRYDPLGLVVLEAMASGLPVVTAKTTGAAAVLNDPHWTLNDPEDVSELVRMILLLAADPLLRKHLGDKNRLAALTHSWAAMAQQYLDLYGFILSEKAC